jgi:pyridoxine 5-phosphate synthase
MDADPSAMVFAKEVGADRVELYTEPYAANHGTPQGAAMLAKFAETAKAAHAVGLQVNAGHDLNLANLRDFVQAVPDVKEVSIGHALMADALERGYTETVKAYLDCLQP